MTLYTTVQLNYSRMPPSHSMHHRRNLYNFYIRFKKWNAYFEGIRDWNKNYKITGSHENQRRGEKR